MQKLLEYLLQATDVLAKLKYSVNSPPAAVAM
jgi:hypothetical protein